MRSAPLLLTIALVGCNGGQPAEKSLIENEAQSAATAATLVGWDRMFGAPGETARRASTFGFRVGAYQADGATFLATGSPVTMSLSAVPRPNSANFELAGPDAAKAQRVAFTLSITDPAHAGQARARFAGTIRDFLSLYAIDDAGALDAVAAGNPFDGTVAGNPASIAITTPREGEAPATITVTFTRSATTTPTFQPAQGQADGNRA